MISEPLVSLISPCYNGEKFISRFLDSCLAQTYTNVEFIFVNDASTDKTEEIFFSYKARLKAKGWKVIYFKHSKNQGPSAALQNGLQVFTGTYLTWPDSDDILYPNYLDDKVKFMQEHIECDLCFSICDIALDETPNRVIGKMGRVPPPLGKDSLFADLIMCHNVVFAPICSFVRSKALLAVLPHRTIYINKAGQNWQILLPLAYHFKAGYITKPLARYIVRHNSLSHDASKEREKLYQLEDILIHVLDSLPLSIEEKSYWLHWVKKEYLKKRWKYMIKSWFIFFIGEKGFSKIKSFMLAKK